MILALTGGTGFVGQAVLDEAAGRGLVVRSLARREQKARAGVEWVSGDLADRAALAALVAGADAVLHIAGVVNAPDRAGFEAGNVAGTAAVLAAARGAGVARFVHVSSLAAREPQLSDYGASKAGAEAAVRASGMRHVIVRPPAIYGPRDTEMLELFRAAARGLVPMPPPAMASVIHVADLARLLLDLAGGPDLADQLFEPDDGRPGGWPTGDLARAIGQAVGREARVVHLPGWLVKAGAMADRLLRAGKAKLTPDRARYMIHPDWACDSARAVPADLWQPRISTPEGLAATARWYRETGWLT